jgi:hypothetical protein
MHLCGFLVFSDESPGQCLLCIEIEEQWRAQSYWHGLGERNGYNDRLLILHNRHYIRPCLFFFLVRCSVLAPS